MGYVLSAIQELIKVATPKLKYNRSYTESVLWLLILFLLFLVFIGPLRHLILRADMLGFFYSENFKRDTKCSAFLKNEIKKTDSRSSDIKDNSLSFGELYFRDLFKDDFSDIVIEQNDSDCDVERSGEYLD